MQSKRLFGLLTLTAALAAAPWLYGQSAYFQAVTNLNPAGYWPLNETAQPPAPFSFSLVASNSGSVGSAGNGYYGAWYQPSGNTWFLTNDIVQTNGITYGQDGDKALWCNNLPGQYVVIPRNTNGVYNPAVTIVPPFSVEAWVLPTYVGGRAGTVISEGEANLNYGGANTNMPYNGGAGGPGWAGFVLGQYDNYFFFNYYMTNGESKANELDSPHPSGAASALITNQWNHIVCTFDGTSETMWMNGVEVASGTHSKNGAGLAWVPDLTTPMMIGSGGDVTANGGGGLAGYTGVIDEVAIYHSILPQSSIVNHYMAGYGTNSSGQSVTYTSVVQGDSPAFYFRLDEPQAVTNAGYQSASYPVATNYGTLGGIANGVYQPGTTPGVHGPSYVGFGGADAVSLNGFLGAVDVGNGSITSALNPVGTVPITVLSWFQGGPADAPARYQDIVSHGLTSYRIALDGYSSNSVAVSAPRFNPGSASGPELMFVNTTDMITNHASVNDGNWHMLAGVSDGTNAYMYIDGLLVKSNSIATGISITGSPVDLLLGGDPQDTAANANTSDTDRTFDGQLAQVAIWTNALSIGQIQSLFNAAGVPPSIAVQPVGVTNDQGADITIPAMVSGSQPITYQWYTTNGTPVAGQTGENLTFTPLTTNDIGGFYLVASSAYGMATSAVVQVYAYAMPTLTSEGATNYQTYAGTSPLLTVSAVGTQPITYQWYSNGVAEPSGTNNSFIVSNAQTTATYTVLLSNSSGTLSVGPFTVTVAPLPTAPYPLAVLADRPTAFWRLDETSGNVAYDYVGGYNGIYTNVELAYLPGSSGYAPTTDPNESVAGFATVFGITNNSYVGWIPTNLNFVEPTNVNAEFSIEAWIQEYYVDDDSGIVAQGYGNGGEEFAIDLGANESTHPLRFYARDAGGATVNTCNTTEAPQLDGLWHHIVAVCDEANTNLAFYIDGTNAAKVSFPTKSGILNSIQSLTIGARQESQGSQYDNQFFGGISQVAVYKYALTSNQVQSHYFASGIAPENLVVSPSSLTTNLGQNATFTATVKGSPALSYSWYGPNNNLISTNPSVTITNVATSDSGNYTIVVSNAYGTVTGYTSLYVVLGPPQIVQGIQPQTQTVELYSGLDTVNFSVVVSGSSPFTYQWYMNGGAIAGATNSDYSFTALAGTNSYSVSVTNQFTASQAGGVPATSGPATVIGVYAPPLNPTNYQYKVKITFPGYTGTPVTNFPALITLSPSSVPGLDFSQFSTNGSDLVFSDASGTAMIPSEIDEWNVGGVSTIWVGIPLLNGTNIWAYWGPRTNATSTLGSTNVWLDAGYQIVYHLKEAALPFMDSTGQYPATNGVASIPTPGVVGHGGMFNGTNYISPGPVVLSNQFTAYAWINIPSNYVNEQSMWVNQYGGYGLDGFSWFVNSYNTKDQTMHADSGSGSSGADPSGGSVSFNTWHLATSTWDVLDGVVVQYLDGVAIDTGTLVETMSLTNQLNLGAFLNPTLFFNGEMDEARIQYGLASTNWIYTTYLNIANSDFVSYSSVNLSPTLYISASAGNLTFSWSTNEGNYVLESTPSLSNPTWTPVTNPPATVVNGENEQTIPESTTGSYFYRLQGQ